MTTSASTSPIKAVFVASMTRSGSMWVFNVTRELFAACGRHVIPERIPQRDEEMIGYANSCLTGDCAKDVAVVKIHSFINSPIAAARFIVTHRDPRDALVSFMRFMRCDFEQALNEAVSSSKICDYYRAFPSELTRHIRYEDVRDRPVEVIRDIARFVTLDVPAFTVDAIGKKFSKRNVAKLIGKSEKSIAKRTRKGKAVAGDEIVDLGRGNRRAFDVSTGFQSGHVTSYRDGDWRKVLSETQISRIHDTLGDWIARNEYGA